MKLYLSTMGCKVSTVESGSIAALLEPHGYTVCASPEEADVLVLSSCTVTASGDSRMLHMLRRLRAAAPEACLVLAGCYVQAFPEEAAALPEADIILGTKHRAALPALLDAWHREHRQLVSVPSYEKEDVFETLPLGTDKAHTRAFLKIQDGCDRFCAYCIIPYARGRSRSQSAEEVYRAAQTLRAKGYQEIVLCGINLACWDGGGDIADAVRLCAEAGFPRVRLGSLEPDGLTQDVLRRLAQIPALCPQLHISVQSGCDRTLRAMRRHYTAAEYLALLAQIRTLLPDAAITTDIMTGFPGETEEDFAETLRFAEAAQFAQMHVFRYSPRPGTSASKMPAQVPEAVKKERADRLSALGRRMQNAFLQAHIGQTAEVLFERERGDGFHTGHARNYARVRVPVQPEDGDWRGRIRTVLITDLSEGRLLGALTDK